MNESKDFELGQQIAALGGKVDAGFDGVNRRLDTLNGKVADHEKRLNDGAIKKAFDDGKNKGVSMTWGQIIAIAGLIGGAFTALVELAKSIIK